VVLVCLFLYAFKQWSAWQGALAAVWMVAALAAPAALMEGRRWGRGLEVARWACAPALLWALTAPALALGGTA
jgi:hypothetical protein